MLLIDAKKIRLLVSKSAFSLDGSKKLSVTVSIGGSMYEKS